VDLLGDLEPRLQIHRLVVDLLGIGRRYLAGRQKRRGTLNYRINGVDCSEFLLVEGVRRSDPECLAGAQEQQEEWQGESWVGSHR
jgi:hypothetical protein